jgi:Squalene-hopene cyclase C-terminal domain/Prenyltransferase and squalene oxidase repeat
VSVGDLVGHAAPDLDAPDLDLIGAAQQLVHGLVSTPWGQVSPSVYETGRVVSLTPWLTGHARRLDYLMEAQRPDGGWGAPDDGYALVPTLSATEALLATLRRGTDRADLADRADRGLRILFHRMSGDGGLTAAGLPDMPAIELIATYLVTGINQRLADPPTGLEEWRDRRLRPPAGLDETMLGSIRAALTAGIEVPEKLKHALEIAGDAAVGLRTISPERTGTIGASPAATAAWLGGTEPPDPSNVARWHLETVVDRHNGPVPCGIPITVFERAWVLSGLVRAGISVTVPAELVLSLTAPLGPLGTPAAAGLPADADTTSGALFALALLGAPHPPDLLRAYETDTHFCTWPGEQGASVSTNAHVLEAFGQYAAVRPDTAARYRPVIGKLSAWLCGQQRPDGSWLDRWHASPYYATACAAFALHAFGDTAGDTALVSVLDRALRWVLETQRADGSWGRWGGTAEETAYAVQILSLIGPGSVEGERAVARGHRHLLGAVDVRDGPPLWHDKDLYLPVAIVRAAVLAALHLGQSAPACFRQVN